MSATMKPLLSLLTAAWSDAAPLLVHYDPDGKPNSVDYVGMIPLLVGAVQAQQREIFELKAEIHRIHAEHVR